MDGLIHDVRRFVHHKPSFFIRWELFDENRTMTPGDFQTGAFESEVITGLTKNGVVRNYSSDRSS